MNRPAAPARSSDSISASIDAGAPPGQATPRRWDTVTIQGSGDAPPIKPVIRALGVDPATQEVWAAIGDEIVHFGKGGNRRAAYHAATKEGVPIDPDSILVESDRILLAADPLGIFDFAIPEKQPAAPAPR
jgi:hypothetical protein